MTDEWDRRCLNTILARYYREQVIASDDKCYLDESGLYQVPQVEDHAQFVDYVRSFPMLAGPQVFGMADNADIVKDQQETEMILASILLTQVRKYYLSKKALSCPRLCYSYNYYYKQR